MKTVSRKTLVEGIIRPRLNEMFQLVAGEIKKSGFAGLTPSGLVLTGGGALTVGILDSAKRILAMPVRVGVPAGISGLVDEIENPGFAVSVGLIKHATQLADDQDSPSALLSSLPRFDGMSLKGVPGKFIGWVKSLLP
jgi:cell division protein FtsA